MNTLRRIVVLLLVAIVIFGGTRVADAKSPDLRLRPNDGPAGSLTTARGRDFQQGSTGTLIWQIDNSALADFAIDLADGVYPGTFAIETSGTEQGRIALCGSEQAIIDGGDVGNGYALHVTGDYWTISGITVTNALKGIMLDDADFTIIDGVTVHQAGHEGVHFRTNSSDNVIQNSRVYDTGLKRDKFGEGIYLGSAVSNWPTITGGDPDQSDRNQVLSNQIWSTTAESIDIKEGTTGGLIAGNVFDGGKLSDADSWVDVKGNDYTIRSNLATNSPGDGFQTHVINDLPWGQHNTFTGNTAEVNGPGFGFYIHNSESSGNVVRCDNVVSGAEAGFANQECA